MPIYEYACSACRHRTEILHGINDSGPNFCPECGAEGTMRKGIAAPAVVFKGSGWAKKDRRTASSASRDGKGKGDEAASEATASEKSSGKDSGKSESGKSESGKSESGGKGSSDPSSSAPDAKAAPKASEGS